ncbi:MAG: hemolysin family protein [Prevotella sp.]|nr:hemolysin family protein [Prevotella sp.]MCH3993826.1 hemolysin family protein [Prevotella sp.]MCI1246758.1 hemolysin family protein [Prevotella sp.]
MNLPLVAGIILTIVLTAFLNGMEIAFVTSNRMLAEMDKDKSGLVQKLLSVFYNHPNDFVSTMVVGNNITMIIYGMFFAELFDTTLFRDFGPASRVIGDTVLSTLVILFTGEFLPKVLFKSNSNHLLAFFAPVAYFFYILLWPISHFTTFLSKLLLRLIGVKLDKDGDDDGFSKVDLDYLVSSSIDSAKNDGSVEDDVKIFHNVLDFPDTKVRDCMIPRTEINAVDENCTEEELMQMFIESGNSKIIVYHNNIDHVIGYIHSSEMFRDSSTWRKRIRTMPFVPETMVAQKLMQLFLQQKKSLGVVVDEFGGTSGIVSLEDVVEEIFGDIEDEHDSNHLIAKRIDKNTYILSARMEIDKVNEKFGLHLPENEDYMTIGGLILYEYKSFPKLNEVIEFGKYKFKIIKNTMKKIELVKLTVEC